MAQSNLINKSCYISNTSKRKILSALTEDCSMTGIASIDRFHMVQMLTRSFNIFRVQIMKQFMTGLIGLPHITIGTLKIISLRNMLS